MAVELVKEKYASRINEVTIGATKEEGGTRSKKVTIGGQSTIPFQYFEGDIPYSPVIAMEVVDRKPEEWPDVVKNSLEDVLGDPAAWAEKCEKEYGADLIYLTLQSAHPDWGNVSVEKVEQTVKSVLEAVSIPLIIIGCGQNEKDNEIFPRCSQSVAGERCLLGMATEENYKTLTASCLADGHNIIALNPIDINIAKQVNILITEMGLGTDRIVMFPTTGGLGYGLEYAYSIMERGKLAALGGDKMMSMPLLATIGPEAWRAKEAKASEEDFPSWGEVSERGPLWEATTGFGFLQAGADILVMRHPRAAASVRWLVEELMKK